LILSSISNLLSSTVCMTLVMLSTHVFCLIYWTFHFEHSFFFPQNLNILNEFFSMLLTFLPRS
jgi:hypothetical protein